MGFGRIKTPLGRPNEASTRIRLAKLLGLRDQNTRVTVGYARRLRDAFESTRGN